MVRKPSCKIARNHNVSQDGLDLTATTDVFSIFTKLVIYSIYRYADDIWFSDHIPEHITSISLSSELAFAYNGKTRKDMIMKIFALCIGLVFSIFAIAV